MKLPDWLRLSDERGRERVLTYIISTFGVAVVGFFGAKALQATGIISIDVGLVGWVMSEFGGQQAIIVFIVGPIIAYVAGFVEWLAKFFRTGRFVEHGVVISLVGLVTMTLAAGGFLPIVNRVVWAVSAAMVIGGLFLTENQKERRESAR